MHQVCKDLLVLQDRLGSRQSRLRLKFREETRATKDLLALKVIRVYRDLLVPMVGRKEKRENQESWENEENQAKMVILVLQDTQGPLERQASLVFQGGMVRQDKKVIVDSQVHQGR